MSFKESYNKIININNKKGNALKYIVCLVIVILAVTGIIIYFSNFNKNEENNTNIVEDNNEITEQKEDIYASASNLPVASYSISLSDQSDIAPKFISPIGLDIVKEDSDCIAVVKLNKILYYTNYSEKVNQYTQVPLTASDVTIEKVFKGNLADSFEMLSIGGIISIKDYEKACQPEQIKKHGFDKMDEKEKETTYIEIKSTMTIGLPKLENDKYYLVYLKYNNNFDKYQVIDKFIYEYDINNDTIKNTDTNEWIKFEYN